MPAYDAGGHLPPRVTLRDRLLQVVDEDIDDGEELTVHYSRTASGISAGSDAVEIQPPYDWLLVWDLARYLLRRTASIDAETKAHILGVIKSSEDEMLEAYMGFVRGYSHARQDRFSNA